MRSPGFEPGLSGWEPDVLTKLDHDRDHAKEVSGYRPDNLSKYEINWQQYKSWLTKKYSKGYARNAYYYSKKYAKALFQTSQLNLIEETRLNNVIDALTALAKYTSNYEAFKHNLKNAGIKRHKQDCLKSFVRILNSQDKDVLQWLNNEAMPHLRDNEKTLAKYLKLSGLRVNEGIESFNLCIKLSKEKRLNEYYNAEWQILCHFKYKQFLRGKKNAFITFITPELLTEICNSKPTTYIAILRNLEKNKTKMRFNELRDYFGTTITNNGITETEQNLVCGRIPTSVFVRHYWTPKIKEIGTRIFKALQKIDNPNSPKPEPQQKPATQPQEDTEILEIKANDINAIKQALLKGYKHADTVEGTRLYMKA